VSGSQVIIRRELVGLLRSRKGFWITALTVGGASLIPLLAWPEGESATAPLLAAESFRTYAKAMAIAFVFFVPVVAGSSVALEREQGTYEPLFHTLISPAGIVLGKLIASSGFFLLLFALTFPMASLLFLLGGFEVGDYIDLALKIVGLVTFLSLAGLKSSLRNITTLPAILGAFGRAALYGLCFLPFLNPTPMAWRWSWPVSPIAVLIVAAIYGFLLYLLFAAILRDARYPDPPASMAMAGPAQLAQRSRPKRTWITRKVLAMSEGGIPDQVNPVLVASVRTEMSGSAVMRQVLFWGFGAIVSVLLVVALDTRDLPRSVLTACQLLLVALAIIMPGTTAASLARERDPGRLDSFRTTLLTPVQILGGKLAAALFGVSGLLALGMIMSLGFIPVLGGAWCLGVLVHFIFGALAVSLAAGTAGLLATTLVQKTAPALLFSYAMAAGSLVVFPAIFEGLTNIAAAAVSPILGFPWQSRGQILASQLSLPVYGVVSGCQFTFSVVLFQKRWMCDP
jgi:ABC-type Na+ efflux pump permease subunit